MTLHPSTPPDVNAEHCQLLEPFTILLYDKTSDLEPVDEARKELFCRKAKSMENLPPTLDALMQHLMRVAYQSDMVHL